jgi:hypothetical protein
MMKVRIFSTMRSPCRIYVSLPIVGWIVRANFDPRSYIYISYSGIRIMIGPGAEGHDEGEEWIAELERELGQFAICHIKDMFGTFSTKAGIGAIF